jgi:hypothetical protein
LATVLADRKKGLIPNTRIHFNYVLDKFCEPIGSSVLDFLSPNILAEVQVEIVLAKTPSA